jgi:pimeloyl-ACP methyl ester carboxylesterase
MQRTTRRVIYFVASVLVAVFLLATFQVLKVRGTFTPSRPASKAGGVAIQAGSSGHRIVGRLYITGEPQPGSPVVIVLHGDAPGVKPSYQYIFASKLATAAPGTRVIALLRPGYADPFGAKSDGDRGSFASGENYTPAVEQDLAAAIRDLKDRFNASRLILVGHSGGATLTADIAALNPRLVQTAILVSCPCDVPAFRHHMARLQWSPTWLLPVNALSPMQTLDTMDADTSILVISGADDPIALPQYSIAYVEKAKSRGLNASMISLPGQGHEILLLPIVVRTVVSEVAREQDQRGASPTL